MSHHFAFQALKFNQSNQSFNITGQGSSSNFNERFRKVIPRSDFDETMQGGADIIPRSDFVERSRQAQIVPGANIRERSKQGCAEVVTWSNFEIRSMQGDAEVVTRSNFGKSSSSDSVIQLSDDEEDCDIFG